MEAEKLILETDSSGHLTQQPQLPPNSQIEAIFLVLKKEKPIKGKHFPHPALEGAIELKDNLISSALFSDEWDASIDRTSRQIEGDEEAFKSEVD